MRRWAGNLSNLGDADALPAGGRPMALEPWLRPSLGGFRGGWVVHLLVLLAAFLLLLLMLLCSPGPPR